MTRNTVAAHAAMDPKTLQKMLERVVPDEQAYALLKHLQDLLAAEDRNDFRRAFGTLVRRWLRRRGLRLSTPSPFDGSTSLHTHLAELELIGEDPSGICYILGGKKKVLRSYWQQDIVRLVAVLDFLELGAEEVLAEMEEDVPGYPALRGTETDPAVLELIDSFWYMHPTRGQMVPHSENLAAFGDWLQETHFGPAGRNGERGRQAAMARKLADVFGWSTRPSRPEATGASYHFCFSNLLKGKRYGWDLRTLPLLADELGTTMEQMVADYRQWLKLKDAKKKGA